MKIAGLILLGRTIYVDVICHTTGGAVSDADSTPSVEIFEDDNDTSIYTPTVTKRSGKTGNYRFPIPLTAGNGFELSKSYNIVVTATVGGTTGKDSATIIIEQIMMKNGSVVADGSNTSSTFKTDLSSSTNDYHKNALLLFSSGNIMDSPRKVTGYNGTTKFVTVNEAYTAVPSTGDKFTLLVW